MSNNFADIITEHHNNCEHLLENAEPGSAEHDAYSQILRYIDEGNNLPDGQRVVNIPLTLLTLSRQQGMDPKIRAILREWGEKFIDDTGQPRGMY